VVELIAFVWEGAIRYKSREVANVKHKILSLNQISYYHEGEYHGDKFE
jgi:hypothetical protein